MKQKAITLICALLCLALFASSIFIFEGYGQDAEAATTTAYPTAGLTSTHGNQSFPIPTQTPAPTHTAMPEEPEEPATTGRNFTQEDVETLAQVLHEEADVLAWRGDRFGVSYLARQSAVAWCALNRLDAGTFGDSLTAVLTAPYQFAYKPDAPITDEMLWLAEDVLRRWNIEHTIGGDAGRTLPSDYLYFEGDGKENYFRKEYRDTGEYWDWSLPDPYKEEA